MFARGIVKVMEPWIAGGEGWGMQARGRTGGECRRGGWPASLPILPSAGRARGDPQPSPGPILTPPTTCGTSKRGWTDFAGSCVHSACRICSSACLCHGAGSGRHGPAGRGPPRPPILFPGPRRWAHAPSKVGCDREVDRQYLWPQLQGYHLWREPRGGGGLRGGRLPSPAPRHQGGHAFGRNHFPVPLGWHACVLNDGIACMHACM